MQQIFFGRGNQVDHLAVERFFFRERAGLGDRGLGKLRIAAALVREAAQERGGIVGDFAPQRFVK